MILCKHSSKTRIFFIKKEIHFWMLGLKTCILRSAAKLFFVFCNLWLFTEILVLRNIISFFSPSSQNIFHFYRCSFFEIQCHTFVKFDLPLHSCFERWPNRPVNVPPARFACFVEVFLEMCTNQEDKSMTKTQLEHGASKLSSDGAGPLIISPL